jgi:hypothetical protein
MEYIARKSALMDLAEFGVVYLNTVKDAIEVAKEFPKDTMITTTEDGIFRLEEWVKGRVMSI